LDILNKDRLKNVGAMGVDISAFPLTWHIAYTVQQLVATAQAVILFHAQNILDTKEAHQPSG